MVGGGGGGGGGGHRAHRRGQVGRFGGGLLLQLGLLDLHLLCDDQPSVRHLGVGWPGRPAVCVQQRFRCKLWPTATIHKMLVTVVADCRCDAAPGS